MRRRNKMGKVVKLRIENVELMGEYTENENH